jgi:ABC-type branched-subunit amino acid transport system permease subunit
MAELNGIASSFRHISGGFVGVGCDRSRRIAIAIGTVATLVILPFVLQPFFVFEVTMVLIYAIGIIDLNLLTGFNGQFSLGHAAFYALGAYTTAIMMGSFGISYQQPRSSVSFSVSCSVCRGCGSTVSTLRWRRSRCPSPRRRS